MGNSIMVGIVSIVVYFLRLYVFTEFVLLKNWFTAVFSSIFGTLILEIPRTLC